MSDKGFAWYEDPALEYLYIPGGTKGMRGYHAPIVSPKITFTGTNGFIDFINYMGMYFSKEDKRILFVVDKDLRKMGENAAKKLKEMKGFEYKIFDNVLSDAPKNTLMDGVKICQEFDPKALIAIGGGSAMDTAKGIFLFHERPKININNLFIPSYLGLRKKIQILAAIPTTSGTGSEATFMSIITDTDRSPPKKTAVVLYELCPDLVVLHTDFVKTMPSSLTSATGLDALAHSMGSYMLNMSNIYTDMHNLKAIELILRYLPRAVKRGNDLEAREKMQIAAYIAGVGFTNMSTNIDHGLGHSFGAIFHAHHGVSVGIFLGAAIAFQAKVTKKFIELAKIFKIDIENKPDDHILRDLLEKLQLFFKLVSFPLSIKELVNPKVSHEEYMKNMDQMVHYAYKDATRLFSTRSITPHQIRRLFEVSYENNIDDLMSLYYK